MSATAADVLSAVLTAELSGDEWLSWHVGRHPRAGTWTTPAQLLRDDAAGLAWVVERQGDRYPGTPASSMWVASLGVVGYPAVALAARLVAARGVRPVLATDALGLGIDTATGDARTIWFREPAVGVLPDHPAAADAGRPGDGVTVHPDLDHLLRALVADAVALMAPFVDAARPRAGIGRRGLWGRVLDDLVWPFAEQGRDEEPDAPRTRVERLLDAAAGTPLAQRVEWVTFTHGGRERVQATTTSCCLAYTWAEPHGTPRREDACDPRWDRYCRTCPLITTEEVVHRARFWLDQPEHA